MTGRYQYICGTALLLLAGASGGARERRLYVTDRSGISVYEFLKRSSVVRYTVEGLAADAEAIRTLAQSEGLDGHAASIRVRAAEE